MASSKDCEWKHTQEALQIFIEDFRCNKCKNLSQEPIRYQKCGHLFCIICIESQSQCPMCNTPAKNFEVFFDTVVSEMIRYSNTICQIINKSNLLTNKEDETESSFSVREPDVSLRLRNTSKTLNKCNKNGESVLHQNCIKRNVEVVRSLLEDGADPNTKDNSNWLPLHESINFGYYEIAELLLEAGADPNIPGNSNRTALHEAVIRKDVQEVKLLQQYNADINARDSDGKTPLDYANKEIHKVLMEDEPVENVLEKTFISTSNMTCLSKNILNIDGTHVFGLNLSSESALLFSKLAQKHKIKTTKTFLSTVTHVVVEVNNQSVTPVSYEILRAILHGMWILKSKWLKDCLTVADLSTIKFESFEVQGITTAPGSNTPMRARKNAQKKNPRLFNGCSFFLVMNEQFKYVHGQIEFTKSTLEKLIKEGDGRILTRKPNPEDQKDHKIPFHVASDLKHPLHRCSQYIIYVYGKNEPRVQYNMAHIKCLPLIWLIESIEQFELLDPAYIGITE